MCRFLFVGLCMWVHQKRQRLKASELLAVKKSDMGAVNWTKVLCKNSLTHLIAEPSVPDIFIQDNTDFSLLKSKICLGKDQAKQNPGIATWFIMNLHLTNRYKYKIGLFGWFVGFCHHHCFDTWNIKSLFQEISVCSFNINLICTPKSIIHSLLLSFLDIGYCRSHSHYLLLTPEELRSFSELKTRERRERKEGLSTI